MADRFQIANKKNFVAYVDQSSGDLVYQGWHWILIGDHDGPDPGVYLATSAKGKGFDSLADLLAFQEENYPDAVVEGIGEDEPEPRTKKKSKK